jgi:predicted DNA-binding protein
MMVMVRAQVQLSTQQLQALRKLSAATGRSIAGLIRDGVDQYLHSQNSVSRDQQVDRALRAARKFSSGRTDVSSRHDRYLAGAFRR